MFFLKEIVSRVLLFSEFLLAYVISNIRENSPGGGSNAMCQGGLYDIPPTAADFHCLADRRWRAPDFIVLNGVEFFVEKSFFDLQKETDWSNGIS